MDSVSRARKAGIEAGRLQRLRALAQYKQQPNVCRECRKVIEVGPNQPVSQVRKKEFCARGCAAKFNNRLREPHPIKPITPICGICNSPIQDAKRKGRKYCFACFAKRAALQKEMFLARTKGDLFSSRKSWQAARSAIQKHARLVYFNAVKTPACFFCPYSRYIEVCHRRPVASFQGSAKISEINCISNLVGLCRNHHWELDHNLVSLDGSPR